MTQERFIAILDDPDKLSGITYEELKTLALAYPFAHNLRYLLALKARQIGHSDADRTLSTAAAYSIDRRRLFQLIAPMMIVPEQMAAVEVLELKSIETVKKELETLAPLPRAEQTEQEAIALTLNTTPAPNIPPVVIKEELEEVDVIPESIVPVAITTIPEPTQQSPEPEVHTEQFQDWIGQFARVRLSGEQAAGAKLPSAEGAFVPSKEKETKKTAAPTIAQSLAERSVSENKDVLSETLAKLYARQGYKEKAISMYERLCLAFPEKSENFAAEIEKLKN